MRARRKKNWWARKRMFNAAWFKEPPTGSYIEPLGGWHPWRFRKRIVLKQRMTKWFEYRRSPRKFSWLHRRDRKAVNALRAALTDIASKLPNAKHERTPD